MLPESELGWRRLLGRRLGASQYTKGTAMAATGPNLAAASATRQQPRTTARSRAELRNGVYGGPTILANHRPRPPQPSPTAAATGSAQPNVAVSPAGYKSAVQQLAVIWGQILTHRLHPARLHRGRHGVPDSRHCR